MSHLPSTSSGAGSASASSGMISCSFEGCLKTYKTQKGFDKHLLACHTEGIPGERTDGKRKYTKRKRITLPRKKSRASSVHGGLAEDRAVHEAVGPVATDDIPEEAKSSIDEDDDSGPVATDDIPEEAESSIDEDADSGPVATDDIPEEAESSIDEDDDSDGIFLDSTIEECEENKTNEETALINSVVAEVVAETEMDESQGILDPTDDTVDNDEIFEWDYLLLPPTMQEDPFPSFGSDEDSDTADHRYDQLVEELALLIPDEWIIRYSVSHISLCLLTQLENTSVALSIFWSGSNANIYVHNRELSKDNFIWNCTKEDGDSLADYLAKLCYLVKTSNLCKGVRRYNKIWGKSEERNEGEVEKSFYQGAECFRDKDCSFLLAHGEICMACQKRTLVLKKRSARLSEEENKVRAKVNVKYLSAEETKTRLKECQEEKRGLYQQVYRLKRAIAKFIKKDNITISSDLSDDIASIFKNNYNNMTPVQKLFWSQQLKALAKQKNPRQIRYSPFIIKMALHIQMISSSAYEYLKNFLNLPSQRTLYDFTHCVEAKEGPQSEVMQELRQKVKETCNENYEEYFNLVFDEMEIRSGIVLNRRTGEVLGYTHLSEVEKEIASFEANISGGGDYQPQAAKKVLVYMAIGVKNNLQDIVGVYTTSGSITAGEIYSRTWNVIHQMESYGNKILSLICDGAPTNKKFFKMHKNVDPACDFVYATKNLASGEDRLVYFIVDPVHVLKSLRNNFANSYATKKTRKMWKNGEDISWVVIEILFSIVQGLKYREVKLSKAHVKLTAHSCMKVIFAAQVMSLSVFKSLHYFKDHPQLQEYPLNELRTFIKLVNDWFDCLNGSSDSKGKRNKENHLLASYSDVEDNRFDFMEKDFLGFFDAWLQDVLNRPGNYKNKEERMKMFISKETYQSINITTRGFIHAVKYMLSLGAPFVDARKFNQDKLEQYFGMMRMAFGGNRNPSGPEVVTKTAVLHIQGAAAKPPRKGNTEVTKEEWVPDERPIPKRPRRQ